MAVADADARAGHGLRHDRWCDARNVEGQVGTRLAIRAGSAMPCTRALHWFSS